MSKFNELLKNLKKSLFGEIDKIETNEKRSTQKAEKSASPSGEVNRLSTKERTEPFIVQIGFDFGTAYSKCVCRDVIANKAWVHVPSVIDDEELPFLMRGTLLVEDTKLKKLQKGGSTIDKNVLYNLKQALEKIALQEWNDPVLKVYSQVIGTRDPKKLSSFIEACSVYFLAGALGDIRLKVRQRFDAVTTLPDDYMAVNLAVPVANAERPVINKTYHKVLCMAWKLADTLAGHPPIALHELEGLLCCFDKSTQEACFIYPEVSANVQGFVRSRASSRGIYLFSDTGAGTVDQGIFIFDRDPNKKECLTYLNASVLPLGSSFIERFAAEISGDSSFNQLEYWRKMKERGDSAIELTKAREQVFGRLASGTKNTIETSINKLYVKDQIAGIRVIFGGGGNCANPYQSAVMRPFSEIGLKKAFIPDIVGLPYPQDLEIDSSEKRWLNRLSVAYGLSFLKDELTRFIYPVNVAIPKPEEIWGAKSNSIKKATVNRSCSCGGMNPDCFRCNGSGVIKQAGRSHSVPSSLSRFQRKENKKFSRKCMCEGTNKLCLHCKGTGIL